METSCFFLIHWMAKSAVSLVVITPFLTFRAWRDLAPPAAATGRRILIPLRMAHQQCFYFAIISITRKLTYIRYGVSNQI